MGEGLFYWLSKPLPMAVCSLKRFYQWSGYYGSIPSLLPWPENLSGRPPPPFPYYGKGGGNRGGGMGWQTEDISIPEGNGKKLR
jgi:hypothetical protein